MNLSELTIKKAMIGLSEKKFSARKLAEDCLKNIEERNKELNVFLEVFDDVLAQADVADKIISSGEANPLTGIPLAIKDNILIKGRKCSSASKILENYTASYDATVIKKLKDAGVIFMGRTNMDEFAMGSSTESSAFGPTKNPFDLSRVPGGSSGGSAVAVASGMALGALGSDTAGSIRQPAAFCGLVGMKPTYGAVSRYGLIALGSSMDQIGPITKTVEDAEIIFTAIAGADSLDATSVDVSPTEEFSWPSRPSLRSVRAGENSSVGFTIGVPRDFLSEGVDPEVLKNFEESLEKLRAAGCKIIDISLPLVKYSLAVYYILMPAEASTNLARYDGMRFGFSAEAPNLLEVYKKTRGEGFGREVRRRIMLGTYVLSHGYYDAYYNKATAVRGQIKHEFEKVFEKVDLIATPTAPTPAFKLGEKIDPVSMYLSDIFTVPANIADLPAVSVPTGKNKDGLPLSFQLMASIGGESALFSTARILEKYLPAGDLS